MSNGIAEQIAAQVTATGITIPDVMARNLPAIVQLFIVISRPVRLQLRAFLAAQESQLEAAQAGAIALSHQGDILADKVNALGGVITEALNPIDRAMAAMPLDSVIKLSPDLASFLKDIADSVPVRVPATQATVIAGIGGFDFFEGVTDYRSLRDKIDELTFRGARAVALSNYANTANFLLNEKLDKIRVYLEVIDTLNIAIKTAAISPTLLSFGSVAMGLFKFQDTIITNTSTVPAVIAGSFTVTGAGFSVEDVTDQYKLFGVGESKSIVVKYSPTLVGVQIGALSIVNNASNLVSPFVVQLSGVGV